MNTSIKSLTVIVITLFVTFYAHGEILVDHTSLDLDEIPSQWIDSAKSKLFIGYGHTSHGSQITSGMNALKSYFTDGTYDWSHSGGAGVLHLFEGDGYGDGYLDHDVGYTGWDDETREYLNLFPECNVIIWSWCGQVNDVNLQTHYFQPMEQLEIEYPDVKFVYMTGHLEGSGTGGSLYQANQQIRNYCSANNKPLFDFADIEKYEPFGTVNYQEYYANDACAYDPDGELPANRTENWASNWIAANPADELTAITGECSSCAHSQCLNCVKKGIAAWYLWAKLAGWDSGVVNNAPILDPIGDKTVDENQLLQFSINATDPDGDVLTYSATGLPTGATFNGATREFTWMPDFTQSGIYTVHFTVTDGNLTDVEDVEITVNNVNRAPVLAAIGNQTIDENESLTLTLSATDPDGDVLTYSTADLPTGATFDGTTRAFSWTPDFTQSGIYTVHFTVTDGNLTDAEDVEITVNNVNRAPELTTIGNRTIDENELLTLTLSAADPDGDVLTFSATGLPTGATFDDATREFSWTPDFTQSGTYTVHFEVTDGSLTDAEDVEITVNDVNNNNQAPVLAAIGNQTIDENQPLQLTLSATDPDGDELTATASGLPAGATFDDVNMVFAWIPEYSQSGIYTVHFAVTDGNLTDAEDVQITVNNVNRSPIANAGPDQRITATLAEGETVTLDGSFSDDPDGDPVTFEWSGSFGTVTGPLLSQNFPIGKNEVFLTVTDDYGASGVDTVVVSISGFTVSIAPDNQSVNRSCTVTYSISVGAVEAYTSPVTLSVTGLPQNTQVSFSKNQVMPGNSAIMTLKTKPKTPFGTYTLTIRGTVGTLLIPGQTVITVTDAVPPADFLLVTAQDTLTAIQGEMITGTEVNVVGINGYTGAVNLAATDLPPAATASFGENTLVPTFISPLTLVISSATPVGIYSITVTGTSGNDARSATIPVKVIHPQGVENTPVSEEPISVPIGNGVSVTYTSVISPGITSVSVTSGGTPPPNSFKLAGDYYTISTDAQYIGAIKVYITYQDAPNEKNYRLRYYDGTSWMNATLSGYPDTNANIIAGQVAHFSDLATMEILDETAPVISVTEIEDDGIYCSGVTPSVSIMDDESGVTYQSIILDGKTYMPGAAVTSSGSHFLMIMAEDFCGNIAQKSINFNIGFPFEIDIKPGDYPNIINLNNNGVEPVAILTTDRFNASDVDGTTVRFAGAPAVRWVMEDVDQDGDIDMILHFTTQELLLDAHSTEATLECFTTDLRSMSGFDNVKIVGKK